MNKRFLWLLSFLTLVPLAIAESQDSLPQDATPSPAHATTPPPQNSELPAEAPAPASSPSNLAPPSDAPPAPVSGEIPPPGDKADKSGDSTAGTETIAQPDAAPAPAGTGDSAPTPDAPVSNAPPNADNPAALTTSSTPPADSKPPDSSDPVQDADLAPAPPPVPKPPKNRSSDMGPPKPGEIPIYLKRVDELLAQHDESMAISYLRRIVPNGILSDEDRSQALIELADCLTESHQPGEALTWLRIWIGLFPGRPEAGAVDFRIGCLYEFMHMPREARDTFYLALSATINHGQIANAKDLKQYSCLTTDILWKMAENEYACGRYTRSAQLFERYRKEASAASPLSKEQAEFLEADAAYQSHDLIGATKLYESCIGAHPFNPLALEARLRLYHLYMLQNQAAKAEKDMESLAWTVRTVWPKDEAYWQKRALELLLEVNKGNPKLQVPILAAAQKMCVSSDLQDELDHYTQLNALQSQNVSVSLQRSTSKRVELNAIRGEEMKVDSLSQSLDRLIPAE